MQIDQNSSTNILIRKLGRDLISRLQPSLERVNLHRGQELVKASQPPSHAYFPEGGVTSVVVLSRSDELPTEVGLCGVEGVSGISSLIDSEATPFNTMVQINGHTALRMDMGRLRELMDSDLEMRRLVNRFIHVMMLQLATSAASYSHNQLAARLARWLPMCCDRMAGDDLALTHEFSCR